MVKKRGHSKTPITSEPPTHGYIRMMMMLFKTVDEVVEVDEVDEILVVAEVLLGKARWSIIYLVLVLIKKEYDKKLFDFNDPERKWTPTISY